MVDRLPSGATSPAKPCSSAGAPPLEAAPIEGADLDAYFGVPAAPFLHNPGRWGAGLREDVAALDGVVAEVREGARRRLLAVVLHPDPGATPAWGAGQAVGGADTIAALTAKALAGRLQAAGFVYDSFCRGIIDSSAACKET